MPGPKNKKFDPQGSGFDIKAAKRAGLKRNKSGHFQSVLPIQPGLGRILKGAKHPTFAKTKRAERNLGNVIVTGPGKSLFSVNLFKLTKGQTEDLKRGFKLKP